MALMDLSSTIEQLAEHHRQLLGYHKFCKMSGILLMAPLLDTLGRSLRMMSVMAIQFLSPAHKVHTNVTVSLSSECWDKSLKAKALLHF